jgi:hypothetical protein
MLLAVLRRESVLLVQADKSNGKLIRGGLVLLLSRFDLFYLYDYRVMLFSKNIWSMLVSSIIALAISLSSMTL